MAKHSLPTKPRRPTKQQERFCQALIDPDIPDYVSCYEAAYNVTNMSRAAQYTEVARLLNNPTITHRYDELKALREGKGVATLDECVGIFRKSVKIAETSKNAMGMTGAAKELGKISDLYPREASQPTSVTINQTVNLTKVEMARRVAHLMDVEGVVDDDNE
jgi:hypothetical protein